MDSLITNYKSINSVVSGGFDFNFISNNCGEIIFGFDDKVSLIICDRSFLSKSMNILQI